MAPNFTRALLLGALSAALCAGCEDGSPPGEGPDLRGNDAAPEPQSDGGAADLSSNRDVSINLPGSDAQTPLDGSIPPEPDVAPTQPSGPFPPENPVCYAPCGEDLQLPDGSTRACSAEGLMAGCLGLLTCERGSCIEVGGSKPACASESECPDFQTCIAGGCYSTCERDADCPSDRGCHRKVCRSPCTVGGGECSASDQCTSGGGADGFCMPMARPSGRPPAEAPVDFSVSTLVRFGPNQTTGRVTITNASEARLVFQVRKHEQVTFSAEGREVERDLPLPWIELGLAEGQTAQVPSIEVEIEAGASADVYIAEAMTEVFARWQGELEVSVPEPLSGSALKRTILEYASEPDGQYTGTLHQFVQFNDRELQAYLNDPTQARARQTRNALLVKWSEFRLGAMPLEQIRAVLDATFEGSYANASTQTACDEQYNQPGVTNCYLYANGAPDDPGVRIFSDSPEMRVPSGALKLPFALNLGRGASDLSLTGRIDSALALQHPGNPPANLTFRIDPADCADPDAAACLVPISAFSATSVVGGRFTPGASGCAAGGDDFERVSTPWLLTDFVGGTHQDPDGRLVKDECREAGFPYSPAEPEGRALNRAAASISPLPDGHARRRRIDLLDGVMVNQEELILLVREKVDGISGDARDDLISYGIAVLKKGTAKLETDALRPGLLPAVPAAPQGLLELSCDPDLVSDVMGRELNGQSAASLVEILLEGTETSSATVADGRPWEPHWLCEDTGRFDGGRALWRDGRFDESCPPNSRVTYFLLDAENLPSGGAPQEQACQRDAGCPGDGQSCACVGAACQDRRGACADTLRIWEAAGLALLNPAWACGSGGVRDPDSVYCEADRLRLVSDKVFYSPRQVAARDLQPLVPAIRQAFRYRTNFRAQGGQSVGFVPAVCAPGGVDLNPYCYDPEAIEALASRMDCLTYIWETYRASLPDETREVLRATLTSQLSDYEWPPGLGANEPHSEGFERLYAELLVMLGDDALTRAAGSRFDLAGLQAAVFEGELFEPSGLSLSGALGNEVALLYKSLQSYDLALGRFHRLSPSLWRLMGDVDANIVTASTVTTYFDRLIRASTRRAEVVSEASKRYAELQQPELARGVIERGYGRAVLEATTMAQFLRRALERTQAAGQAQMVVMVDQAALRYEAALRRMRGDYGKISDNRTLFGFAPDFVPFISIAGRQENSARVGVQRAYESLAVARIREDEAIEQNRAVETGAATFQSDLVRVRNQYDNELASLCGTLTGPAPDRRVLPATVTYRDQDATALALGDPCGLLGQGEIYQAIGRTDDARLGMRLAIASLEKLFGEVEIEQGRSRAECNGRDVIATAQFEIAGATMTVDQTLRDLRQEIAVKKRDLAFMDADLARSRDVVSAITEVSQAGTACHPKGIIPPSPAACIAGVVAAVGQAAVAVATTVTLEIKASTYETITDTEDDIETKQAAIADLQRTAQFEVALSDCCLDVPVPAGGCTRPGPLLIDSVARIDRLMLGLLSGELNILRAELTVRLAYAEVGDLRNRVSRLMAQRTEADQNVINIEAARSDPNVRLTRNAAVLDADRSFEDALVDAYRATRIFEYYSGQSYGPFIELLLSRMVRGGDYSLDNYVLDLDRALRVFEEDTGRPELRLAVISLKEDIFQIPRTAANGKPLEPNERDALFQERLFDPSLIDARGAINVPFSTARNLVSPLTHVHKIDHLEANINGTGLGDGLGRLFISQRGTGTVEALDGTKNFYRFEPRTAVINTFFHSTKPPLINPQIYENERFRDRPFLNSEWLLGLDLHGEEVNRDIGRGNLQDIDLYIYYTDFVRP